MGFHERAAAFTARGHYSIPVEPIQANSLRLSPSHGTLDWSRPGYRARNRL